MLLLTSPDAWYILLMYRWLHEYEHKQRSCLKGDGSWEKIHTISLYCNILGIGTFRSAIFYAALIYKWKERKARIYFTVDVQKYQVVNLVFIEGKELVCFLQLATLGSQLLEFLDGMLAGEFGHTGIKGRGRFLNIIPINKQTNKMHHHQNEDSLLEICICLHNNSGKDGLTYGS